MRTAFTNISRMNDAYGNPSFSANGVAETLTDAQWEKIRNQAKNILDEYKELIEKGIEARNIQEVRDGVCDIIVFTGGVGHFIGMNVDADLDVVYTSNMSKFIANDDELELTLAKYHALGVKTYTEGEYPVMRVKCAEDFTDANGNDYRKGKMLKGIAYKEPVFK